MKRKLVVLTGAGMSAESGLKTFRDAGGLWENHRVEEVATPEAWERNTELVLRFYNERRQQLLQCQPNPAHVALADLQNYYDVTIITQNVDDLHERAGSSKVIHLHGELLKVRSSVHPHLIYDCKRDVEIGDNCELGFQLRPHIVWFGEAVPMIELAVEIVQTADVFLVIGTSLLVYPAASLVHYTRNEIPKWMINPDRTPTPSIPNLHCIYETATVGMTMLWKTLLEE